MNKNKIILLLVPIGIIFGLLFSYLADLSKQSDSPAIEVAQEQSENVPTLESTEESFPFIMPARSTFSAELQKLDVTPKEIHQLVLASKPHKDLGRINPGTKFQVIFNPSVPTDLMAVNLKLSHQQILRLKKIDGHWTANIETKEVTTRIVTFKGSVESTLWESALDAQMNPNLIADLAEIFAWQVDFSREVQIGDKWRLSVEEELVQGEHIGWGSILSAEYVNRGEVHTAVLFKKDDETVGYFTPEGNSLKKVFLKSPIQYGRISSRFSKKRFHPVLKYNRPHLGVDYAAPIGTPIRAVGDGTVEFAAYSGGGGNVIKIRHNSVYQSAYKHLSRFAKGIRRGAKVQQGQTIGYVGSTGLSTGPHLHYEFYVNGSFVDPLNQKFPTAEPISQNYLAAFTEQKAVYLAYLPLWENE
jgi:murein DD-endopeptidase MepM/ murein hydrolase activator NlpD